MKKSKNIKQTDEEKIKSQKKVAFKYPGKEEKKDGILKDRAIVYKSMSGKIPYWDIVDLIEFKGEKWMRIGYYRKKKVLRFASQTTITEPISIWKDIFVNAAKEKEWFRKLLKEVIAEQPKWDK
jgi:hypothetical protein